MLAQPLVIGENQLKYNQQSFIQHSLLAEDTGTTTEQVTSVRCIAQRLVKYHILPTRDTIHVLQYYLYHQE